MVRYLIAHNVVLNRTNRSRAQCNCCIVSVHHKSHPTAMKQNMRISIINNSMSIHRTNSYTFADNVAAAVRHTLSSSLVDTPRTSWDVATLKTGDVILAHVRGSWWTWCWIRRRRLHKQKTTKQTKYQYKNQ